METEEYAERALVIQKNREKNSDLQCSIKKIFSEIEKFDEESNRWLNSAEENICGISGFQSEFERLKSESRLNRETCNELFESEKSRLSAALSDIEDEKDQLDEQWRKDKNECEEVVNG